LKDDSIAVSRRALSRSSGERRYSDIKASRLSIQAVQSADGKEQREHEQPDAQPHHVVAQLRGGDDPWRKLPADDLDRNQHRAEGENDERQRERDDGLGHRGLAGDPAAADVPAGGRIEGAPATE
jgi:hypothetical protein